MRSLSVPSAPLSLGQKRTLLFYLLIFLIVKLYRNMGGRSEYIIHYFKDLIYCTVEYYIIVLLKSI